MLLKSFSYFLSKFFISLDFKILLKLFILQIQLFYFTIKYLWYFIIYLTIKVFLHFRFQPDISRMKFMMTENLIILTIMRTFIWLRRSHCIYTKRSLKFVFRNECRRHFRVNSEWMVNSFLRAISAILIIMIWMISPLAWVDCSHVWFKIMLRCR